MKTTTDVQALKKRVEALEEVCGEAYQFAGSVGAPVRVLDKLLAAAEGRRIPRKSFLPIGPEECDEVKELRAAIKQLQAELTASARQAEKALNIFTRARKRGGPEAPAPKRRPRR